jgi:putative addiction module CopG family antidote
MNVRLGKFEAWVQTRVESGDYASSAEVIRAGLRLLKEDEEWRAEMRRRIAEGAADLQEGRVAEGEAVFARLRRELDAERDPT